MAGKLLDPIHPGEILAEELMAPFGLSANALAKLLGVPVTRVSEIVRGRRGVTADTALRLARCFGTSADLWMGLQTEHDLRTAERQAGPRSGAGSLPLPLAELPRPDASPSAYRRASGLSERE
jgi:antitoxin HigA-1